jgi:hypothetical protein
MLFRLDLATRWKRSNRFIWSVEEEVDAARGNGIDGAKKALWERWTGAKADVPYKLPARSMEATVVACSVKRTMLMRAIQSLCVE